jgi:glycyl-tRNA synthetase beta chain
MTQRDISTAGQPGATGSLLIELRVEELPPKALKALGQAFADAVCTHLRSLGLASADTQVTQFASPRRLAVHLTGVLQRAADRAHSQKLMPASVALDAQGEPTPSLLKKLASLGLDAAAVPGLQRRDEAGGKPGAQALYLDSMVAGVTLAAGLQAALDAAWPKLPIPKLMSYQLADGWDTVRFVRPAHSLVALHGTDVVPVTALGLHAGRTTQGHRFEAASASIEIREADSYDTQMRDEGAVTANFATRRAEIEQQLAAAAAAQGLTPVRDEALLDEVTGLVERPNVLTCRFETAFLDVPPECLILTMKANQKYFPLLDAEGRLTAQFLVVSNIRPDDPSAVIDGNERVVRPRLADAKFFFEQDRKKTLESRLPGLAKVVYHGKLGSQRDRVERVRQIAQAVAALVANSMQAAGTITAAGAAALAAQVDRATLLAKADLLTDMVGEFPELQGIMGGYYARHDGEAEAVALAVEDHYKPRFAGDALPRNEVGLIVALADKLETLVGLFGIGQLPTGDKDPFALRRHALGVIRMLVDRGWPVGLDALLAAAVPAFGPLIQDPSVALQGFFADRLAGTLRDAGYTAQEVDAVVALAPQHLADVGKRLEAVRQFTALPEAASLASANKRVGNILKKAEGQPRREVDEALLVEDAERHLLGALHVVQPMSESLFLNGEYAASLRELASLKAPVDAFFDGVMVNADDPALRANRLALLARLHGAMNRVADLSRLAA